MMMGSVGSSVFGVWRIQGMKSQGISGFDAIILTIISFIFFTLSFNVMEEQL